jgi:monoamine oxidase
MARTSLMQSFVRLAAEHEAAGRLRIPVDEVRARQARRAISRREFLRRAGGAGLVLAGASAWPTRARGATTSRIVIVGGGIAGLSAALTLADKGVASTVYEASGRVGGRMHSDTSSWLDGQVSEWCGEFVDSGHKTIRALAQRFRLPLDDYFGAYPAGSSDTYYFFGGYYPKSQADTDFQPVHQALQTDRQAASYPTTYKISTPAGIALDNMSVYEWIESRVPGGHASPLGALLDVAYVTEFGADSTDQAALNLVYLLAYQPSPGNFSIFGGSDERYHIRGGSERLPKAIAAALPGGSVKLGHRMVAIKTNRAGTLTVTFDTGAPKTTSVTADHVVLAMHFGVLRTLDFRGAGFDPLKQQAIRQLGLGKNDKLRLQFKTRQPWTNPGPWPGKTNGTTWTDQGYQAAWEVSVAQPGVRGIQAGYPSGSYAATFTPASPYSTIETEPKIAGYAQQFLDQIEPVLPGLTAAWNGKASLSVPHLDPNYNCSYSYYRVGQYHTFSGYEALRQGNIHFAGEHCTEAFQGYMEGGAITGVAAANEILADLKRL